MRCIDAIFDVERTINGLPAEQRRAVWQADVAPLVAELEGWMRTERARMSRHAEVAKAMDYMLKRWDSFSRFLHDGRICLTNNAAERALRGVALGRNAWLFCGSDRGGERAAAMYSLIVTAKLNDVDPRAWLADVLRRIATTPSAASMSCCPGTGTRLSRTRPLQPAVHKVTGIREAVEAAGARLLFLTPYSPDFNPIENAFAKLKALLRTAAARTVEDLHAAIHNALARFTPHECRNSVTAAGYENDAAISM